VLSQLDWRRNWWLFWQARSQDQCRARWEKATCQPERNLQGILAKQTAQVPRMADPKSQRSHLAFQSYYEGQAGRYFGRIRSCLGTQTLPWLVHAQTHHGWEDPEISKDPGRKSWDGFWSSAQDAQDSEQKWTGAYLLQFDVSSAVTFISDIPSMQCLST